MHNTFLSEHKIESVFYVLTRWPEIDDDSESLAINIATGETPKEAAEKVQRDIEHLGGIVAGIADGDGHYFKRIDPPSGLVVTSERYYV